LARRPREALTVAFERRHAMEQLHLAALTDPLTGLANRTRFFDALAEVERSGADYAVCYLDLDRFKAVNDDHGHLAGDHLLVACAERLRSACGQLDVVARLGGDEFGVVLVGASEAEVERLADCLVEELASPVQVGASAFTMGASVGVAIGRHGAAGDLVVAAADEALYRAKRDGRGVWRLGEPVDGR
jgi:diguanylate cyclase (GGDEF)-like protein